MRKEVKLNGVSVVAGQGLGQAFFVGRAVQQTSVVAISRQDVGDQVMLFNEVREQAKNEYRDFAKQASEGDGGIDASILYIYEHILDDPAFIGQVVETITTKLYDLETAIRFVSNDFIKRFNSAGTSYFRERSSDMVEICEKLISYLRKEEGRAKTFMNPVVLVVLRTFTPSDILNYDRSKIEAIISASGGKTSHAAILARTYNIPVITGIKNITQFIHPGDELFVNADKGVVHVRPNATVTAKYETLKANDIMGELRGKWERPVYTVDGIKIEVMANVSVLDDIDESLSNGADGIGLVRTEYLLSNRKNMPSEEEQQVFYENIFKRAGSKKHCVIRLMDIGGDKIPQFFDMPSEFNPFMGWRAIRIFLDQKKMFHTQVSAIMKAARGNKNYSIMIPMITTLQEWLEAKEFIQQVALELDLPVPPLGVLFEVPLAVLEMGTFMKEIDFASIGTNDLIQYLSAADRNNSKVNYLYNPIEPAFLRIIKSAIEISNNSGKPVSICGEMAANPYYTVLLIGLGLRRFSVIPRNIPIIKEIISKISFAQAAEAVSHIEAIDSTDASAKWLKNINRRLVGELLTHYNIVEDI
jgi:phosphoenolpyruvate-protein phosphotransferase